MRRNSVFNFVPSPSAKIGSQPPRVTQSIPSGICAACVRRSVRGQGKVFHSFAIGGLALRQKGLRAPGIVMDRLPTPDIDSTCSEESSLRTAWISRRDRRPKTRVGERADNKDVGLAPVCARKDGHGG